MRYDYIHLNHTKSQTINTLEVYMNEIKRQLDRKVKIIISDKSDEFYSIYDEPNYNDNFFARLLEK